MSDTTDQEREEMDALLTSAGWAHFRAYAEREWGPAGERYQQAVEQAIANREQIVALDTLRLMILARKEIQRLLSWPAERVELLRRRGHATTTYDSRRGSL